MSWWRVLAPTQASLSRRRGAGAGATARSRIWPLRRKAEAAQAASFSRWILALWRTSVGNTPG